jgi:CBS domain-containing protein
MRQPAHCSTQTPATGKPPVLSVNPHVPALLAYAQQAAQQVSGAPVVTDSGELIANLSISDIR